MFVLVEKYGQLGNRLILSAHFLAAAIEHRSTLVNIALDEYAAHFEGTSHDLFSRFPPCRSRIAPWPWLRRTVYRVVRRTARLLARLRFSPPGVALVHHRSVAEEWPLDGPELANLVGSKRVVLFRGWTFRARLLLAKHADEVRRVFTPVADRVRRIDLLLAPVRADADVVVGVHVRRGDYRTFVGGRHFHEVGVYARWMQAVLALFPGRRTAFLVCSDERLRAEDFPGCSATVASGDAIDDMYALARCDYLIGPPSTFTAWASFHGRVPFHVLVDPEAMPTIDGFSVAVTADVSLTS